MEIAFSGLYYRPLKANINVDTDIRVVKAVKALHRLSKAFNLTAKVTQQSAISLSKLGITMEQLKDKHPNNLM